MSADDTENKATSNKKDRSGGLRDLYFDDFTVGQQFVSEGFTLTQDAILDFAFRYDPQPFHMDVPFAQQGPYGGLIASGFHTLAIGFRMFTQTRAIAACSMGSPGMEDLRWLEPVRPGDTLWCVAAVLALRVSQSKPDRGVSRWQLTIANQNETPVLSALATIILRRRPDAD